MTPFADLVADIGTLIGGLPGTVVRYAARIIAEQERYNHRVAVRIEQDRRTHMAAGAEAYRASKAAGR